MDKNDSTPILTAAAYENDDAFNTMVERGHNFLKNTLFQAAKELTEPNIKALKVMLMILMFNYFLFIYPLLLFFPNLHKQTQAY